MGFKTGSHGKVYNDDKKSHGSSKGSPGNNDGSNESYRETLNMDQFDDMPWIESKQFGVDDKWEDESIADTAKAVQKYADKINGIVYTQIDNEDEPGHISYERGMHLVNRTGVFEVVKL